MSDVSLVLTELLADAESRTPWVPDDTKSGARFERVVIGGERFVLKYQDPRLTTGSSGPPVIRVFPTCVCGRAGSSTVSRPSSITPSSPRPSTGPSGWCCCATSATLFSRRTRRLRPPNTPGSSTTWPRCRMPPSGRGVMMWALRHWSGAI